MMRRLSGIPINATGRRLLGRGLLWGGLLTMNLVGLWHLLPPMELAVGSVSALLVPVGLALWLSGRPAPQTRYGQGLRSAWVAGGVALALFMVYSRYRLYQAQLVVRAYQTSVLAR